MMKFAISKKFGTSTRYICPSCMRNILIVNDKSKAKQPRKCKLCGEIVCFK